jgi:hypothetical protein
MLETVVFDGESRLRRIERKAFCGTGLRSLSIPASTEFVHGSALACDNHFRVDVGMGSRHLAAAGDFVTSCDGKEIIRYYGHDLWVVVPAGVEVLQENSFEWCRYLLSIEFEPGSRLRILGSQSFMGCRYLQRIVIPGTVELIGIAAFADCFSIEICEFERPSHLARIEEGAFAVTLPYQMPSLTSLDFPGSLEFIGVNCFSGCQRFSRLIFDSGLSLGRVVGALGLDEFLTQVGIQPMIGELQIEVRDGEFRHDVNGWVCESCGGTSVCYVREY